MCWLCFLFGSLGKGFAWGRTSGRPWLRSGMLPVTRRTDVLLVPLSWRKTPAASPIALGSSGRGCRWGDRLDLSFLPFPWDEEGPSAVAVAAASWLCSSSGPVAADRRGACPTSSIYLTLLVGEETPDVTFDDRVRTVSTRSWTMDLQEFRSPVLFGLYHNYGIFVGSFYLLA
jgi:hypothetical protein